MREKKRYVKLSITLLVLVLGRLAFSENVRLGFAQVAVGDVISTRLDLSNLGLRTFEGTLLILDDSGAFLPVSINGDPVSGPFDLRLGPNEAIRLLITSEGEARAGHALIRDQQTYKSIDFGRQIDGTAVFELRNGEDQVIDSVGVPASSTVFLGSGARQHFFFPAEAGLASTGLALSNVFPGSAGVRLIARHADGTVADSAEIDLPSLGHRAFFIQERLTLSPGFVGTVEVEADRSVFALALRQSETGQLSTVQVSAYPLFFDFILQALGQDEVRGEMTLNVADGLIRGLVRITSHNPDGDFDVSPVTGSYIPGLGVIGTFYTSLKGQVTGITFLGFFTEKMADDHEFAATWAQLDVSFPATLSLTRKEMSIAEPTRDKARFLAEHGPWTVVAFDDIATGTTSPVSSNGVTIEAQFSQVLDASNSVAPHAFFFGDEGSPPKFFGSLPEFKATFETDVSSVGFELSPFAFDSRRDDSIFRWTLFSDVGAIIDAGTIVYDLRVGQAPPAKFFGLVSKVPFRSVSVARVAGATWLIDDLRYSPVQP